MLSDSGAQLYGVNVAQDSVYILIEETQVQTSMWVFDEVIADLFFVIFDLFQQLVHLLVSLVVFLQNDQLFLLQSCINSAIHSCDLTERLVC